MDGMMQLDGTASAPAPQRLEALVGRMLGDLGGAYAVPLARLGGDLGLYAAMDGAGTPTPAELARRTGTNARLVREWLCAQAAAGYLEHASATGRFAMTPEQAMVFARPDSPVFMQGAFEVIVATVLDHRKVARAFRDPAGRGAGYGARCAWLFSGTERFFRPGYAAHLLQDWLPALEGVEERLRAGAFVADLGCGHGAAVIMMAEAFPASRFVGLDSHAASVICARDAAARAGVAARVRFEVGGASAFALRDCDLIACLDALHDMGDPVGAAARVREALRPGGVFMVVEPRAGDRLEDNMSPVGRLYHAGSTTICTPVSLDQPGSAAPGARAGPARLEAVLRKAGFSRVRVAAEAPFSIVLEARP